MGFRRSPILLAFTKLHEWLPCPSEVTGNLNSFSSTLENAGIARVAFLRHGKTAPAENGIDFERQLTDIGREQAIEAGLSFGKDLKPFFPTLNVSPAPRTMETANLFVMQLPRRTNTSFVALQSSMMGPCNHKVASYFKRLDMPL